MALPLKSQIISYLSSLWRKLRFSKRGFCILGLAFGSAMAEYSFLGFFILFIKERNKQNNMRYSAVVSNAKDSLSALLASFLAYATHQRISPLIEILLTYLIFITGMLILLLTLSRPGDGIFYLAIVLLSVDKSGEAYMDEFAADRRAVDDATQVTNDNKENPNNRIDAWRFIGRSAGALIGSIVISNLSSKLTLIISAIVMGIGCIFFYSYCIYYELTSGDPHHHQKDKRELKQLLKLLPLWAPFLFYYVVDAAGSTFFMEQGEAMGFDAAVYLYMIQKFSGSILLRLIGWVITKFWSEEIQQEQHARLAKITCGMFVCFWICIDAWHVEVYRLAAACSELAAVCPELHMRYVEVCRLAAEYPKLNLTYVEGCRFAAVNPELSRRVMFSRLFILLGVMNGMVEGMLREYFCDRVSDQSLHHLEYSFNTFVEGMGRLLGVVCIIVFKSWIGKTVNDSRLDCYYGVLAIMTLCALLVFVCLSKTCYRKKRTKDDDDLTMLEEGRLHSSGEIEGTKEDNCEETHQSKPDSVSQSTESSVYHSADESSPLVKLDGAKSTSNSKWSILRSHFNDDLRRRPAAKTISLSASRVVQR